MTLMGKENDEQREREREREICVVWKKIWKFWEDAKIRWKNSKRELENYWEGKKLIECEKLRRGNRKEKLKMCKTRKKR